MAPTIETPQQTSTAALLARLRDQRDDGAFALLCERHSAVVAATARRLGSPDAEEAAQVVFFVLWQRSAAVRGGEHLVGWLLGVTRGVVANQRRMATRRLHHEHEAAMDQQHTATVPHQEPAWHEARHLLDDALASLSARRREALVRFYLEGKSQSTVAQELGCSVEAVKNRIHEGLANLRTLLARRGAALDLAALTQGLAAEAASPDAVLSLACSQARSAALMPPRMAANAHTSQHLIGRQQAMRRVGFAIGVVVACGVAALVWPYTGPAPGPATPPAAVGPGAAVPAHGPPEPASVASRWSVGPAPAHSREGQEAVLLADGTILVLGGERWYHGHLAGAISFPGAIPVDPNRPERYDPARRLWSAVAPMLQGRSDGSYTATRLADGKVLVVGGCPAGRWEPFAQCEIFAPATGSWSLTAALGQPRAGHRAALLADGTVLVAGGDGDGHTCELYDPRADAWSVVPPTSENWSSLVTLSDGTVLASGGGSCERYDPATRTWRATGALLAPRTGHTATVLDDGRVLVTGGDAPDDYLHGFLASCELYDPRAGTWSATAALPQGRLDYAVARLPSGHVLAIGGKFREFPPGEGIVDTLTASCLEYAPETGSWSEAPSLQHARDNLTATTLRDGRIVVVGGRELTDIETYAPVPPVVRGGGAAR